MTFKTIFVCAALYSLSLSAGEESKKINMGKCYLEVPSYFYENSSGNFYQEKSLGAGAIDVESLGGTEFKAWYLETYNQDDNFPATLVAEKQINGLEIEVYSYGLRGNMDRYLQGMIYTDSKGLVVFNMASDFYQSWASDCK